MNDVRMVKLGEVAKIERKSIKPENLDLEATYIGLEHIQKGGRIIGRSTVHESSVQSSKFEFTSEHILYGKLRPYLAKISTPDFDGVCSTDILPIRAGEKIDKDYLYFYLKKPDLVELANKNTTGANLPRISSKALEELPIQLPPLEEQKRIASKERIKQRIEQKRERQRELLAELEKSVFREMFGDFNENLVKLGDVAEVVSGITKGRKAKEPTRMVPYLAVSNVQAGALKLEVVKEIDATEAEIERYRLKNGDLVLTEGGDHDKLGRGTIWREELPEAIHQNHIFRVRLNEDSGLLPEYVEAYLADNRARAYFLKSAKQTTGIASINKTQLSNLLVPVAAEQRNFIDILYRLNKFTLIRKV